MFLYSAACIQSVFITQIALHLTSKPPGRPVHSDTNSTSLRSILATQPLRTKNIHSHFHHCLHVGPYSQVLIYIQLSELGRHSFIICKFWILSLQQQPHPVLTTSSDDHIPRARQLITPPPPYKITNQLLIFHAPYNKQCFVFAAWKQKTKFDCSTIRFLFSATMP